jgi:serine protease AprX
MPLAGAVPTTLFSSAAGPGATRSSWGRVAARRAAVVAAALTGLLAAPAHALAAEAIVQFPSGASAAQQHAAVAAAGARVTRDLHLIGGLGVEGSARALERLAADPRVAQVTPDAPVRTSGSGVPAQDLVDSYPASVYAPAVWATGLTGRGVGVAVIDTGVAGDLPDFRVSEADPTSRVVASVVTNPDATTAEDTYGHGTHVAGILAGDGTNRPSSDPLDGRHIGIAPDAHLVSIKASDDDGAASVLDVVYGVQFAVDHASEYGIRVINLSLESSATGSYTTDPLDAAVESAWMKGLVVVAAAGNRGATEGAVDHAPGNDPYVITVGGADDQGTKSTADDDAAVWGSLGVTQDGVTKPEIIAPGAHITSTLAPGSAFAQLCPTCVRDGGAYFQAGGTSMAAPVVSGIAALLLQKHPDWTPDQVKGALVATARPLAGDHSDLREVVADDALAAAATANAGLVPNTVVDAATGDIDFARASWSRASWSTAADALRASWSRASWSCACDPAAGTAVDPTRASWSRASWSRASWSTSWTK